MGISDGLDGLSQGADRQTGPLHGARFWWLLVLLVMPFGSAFCEGEMERREKDAQDRLPVVVYLAVDGGSAASDGKTSAESIDAVRTTVMERLRELLSRADFASVRTFEHFPAIALSASPDVIGLLLTMPEVDSIGHDPELMPLEDVKLDFN